MKREYPGNLVPYRGECGVAKREHGVPRCRQVNYIERHSTTALKLRGRRCSLLEAGHCLGLVLKAGDYI